MNSGPSKTAEPVGEQGEVADVVEDSYLSSKNLDDLARINMALMSELWITRDRLAVLEELLTSRGVLEPGEADGFSPDPAFSERLERLRALFVENVLGAPLTSDETVASLKAKGKAMKALADS